MNVNVGQAKHSAKHAWELIKQANKITLLTHHKPDADGMSACAALSSVLEKMGKKTETIYPSIPEFPLKRVCPNVLIARHNQHPDLLIACDTANYERLYFPQDFQSIPLINIDHHVSNSLNGVCNIIDLQVSSTCELLYNLLVMWDERAIDAHVAECLLLGILYDSQVFHTQATTPQTLRVSAELIERGANLFQLKAELLANKNYEIIKLWGEILLNVHISHNRTAAWVSISQSDLERHNLTLSSLIGFSNFLWEMSEIDITLVFYEMSSGQTKVSLRSKKSDVNKLAARFGGGGHKNAAGILSDRPLFDFMHDVTKDL